MLQALEDEAATHMQRPDPMAVMRWNVQETNINLEHKLSDMRAAPEKAKSYRRKRRRGQARPGTHARAQKGKRKHASTEAQQNT